jgi:hypothetical protein
VVVDGGVVGGGAAADIVGSGVVVAFFDIGKFIQSIDVLDGGMQFQIPFYGGCNVTNGECE